MKIPKIILLTVMSMALLTISCSTDEGVSLQEEENLLITEEMSVEETTAHSRAAIDTSVCTYFNANPFTEQTETFGCDAPAPKPNTIRHADTPPCFPTLLELYLSNDFENQILNGNTFVEELNTSLDYYAPLQFFSERGVPLNACLYPYIQSNHANIVFRSISCEIQEYFETLPALPANQFYYPNITYLNTGFTFDGPHSDSSIVDFTVEVKIWVVE
ncbi:hypothetical protein [uncultured Dokdonia sp.]|uniref:hypothetical protein n=1 Tax=uncultured Dokdonia sp. TaxID=575653 RepID=UPI002625B9F8|nr:hypothetical protein [uncultured Dokdonia sp.]